MEKSDDPRGRNPSAPTRDRRGAAGGVIVVDARNTRMPVDRHQVESFLYREARLMDEHAYDEWLALWTDDALYWVPSNDDDYDPQRHVSIVYENKARLEDRIFRLKSGVAYAQDPKSRLSRIVANVEIEEADN